MKCKKCGCDVVGFNHYGGLVNEHIKYCQNIHTKVPEILTTVYKNHKRAYFCGECNTPIDYQDMPMEMFFSWLQYSSDAGDSHEDSGKAFIRYFKLDKLLSSQSKGGDES